METSKTLYVTTESLSRACNQVWEHSRIPAMSHPWQAAHHQVRAPQRTPSCFFLVSFYMLTYFCLEVPASGHSWGHDCASIYVNHHKNFSRTSSMDMWESRAWGLASNLAFRMQTVLSSFGLQCSDCICRIEQLVAVDDVVWVVHWPGQLLWLGSNAFTSARLPSSPGTGRYRNTEI
jgi:hypothetical protein